MMCTRRLSLPLWECGLKYRTCNPLSVVGGVTPLVGVWIEMDGIVAVFRFVCVTPLVGVWIEISYIYDTIKSVRVTPLVGVWIEIVQENNKRIEEQSHSPCGSVD